MDRTHLPRSSVGSVALAVALWTLAASTARAECPAPPATVDLADGFALCTPAAPGYPEGTAVAMRVGLPDGTLIAAGIGVIGKPVPLTVPAGVLASREGEFEVVLLSMVRGIESAPRTARVTYRPR